MVDPLWQKSACELASGIRQREYSCADVMESVVGRIRSKNGVLNAIVYDYTEEALVEARRADDHLAKGLPAGPIHGIPVTIKENVDQRGTPTPNGMKAFAGTIAPDDAPLVRNLRNAGAIIVGRTNTPELSMRATTDNPLHGRTYNPWHPDASPGGSSGGAGAAAAAGFGPIHHGNDIGGSLRFPAFACGLATVKPTPGRIAAWNPSAAGGERGLLAQLMSVQGAICREVRDVRLATRVMSGRDARDPWWVPVPFDGEPLAAPIRVAFTRNAHGYPIHAEIVRGLERAAGWLTAAGYAVEEIEPPPITEPARAWFSVAVAEMKTLLFPIGRTYGSLTIQDIFNWFERMANAVDAVGYMAGIAARTRMTRQWSMFLEDYPLVLTPFLMRPTYSWNYDTTFDGFRDLFEASIYSYGINYLGLPAGVVPIGTVDDLPAGIQIVGRRFREDTVLDAMEIVESNVGILARILWARET